MLPGMRCLVICSEAGMRVIGKDVKLLKGRWGIGSGSKEVLGQERLADGHGGIEGEGEMVPLVGNPTLPEQAAEAINLLKAEGLKSDASSGISVSQADSTGSFNTDSGEDRQLSGDRPFPRAQKVITRGHHCGCDSHTPVDWTAHHRARSVSH